MMRRIILSILVCYVPGATGMQSLLSTALIRSNKKPTILKKDAAGVGRPKKFCTSTNSLHEKKIEFEFRKYLEVHDYGSMKRLLQENKFLLIEKPIVDLTILSNRRQEFKQLHEEFIVQSWTAGLGLGLIAFTALAITGQGPGSDPRADIFTLLGVIGTPTYCIAKTIGFRQGLQQQWPEKIKIIKEIEDEFYFLFDNREVISKESFKESDYYKG